MKRADCCIRSDFSQLVRVRENYHRCFFISSLPRLYPLFFFFCRARLFPGLCFVPSFFFWYVVSVHLTSLPPPVPPTTFYVSALNVFKQGDTTLAGSEREGGALTNTCTYRIISNIHAVNAS